MMQNIIISMLIFSAVAIGLTAFMFDLSNNYGNTNINLSYLNKTSHIEEKINETYSALNVTTPLSKIPYVGGFADSFWGFFSAAWNGVFILIELPFLIGEIITNMISVFALSGITIPTWFSGLIGSVILVSLIMFLIIFLREGRVKE